MTLDELAKAMRGMPRDGLILVRLPDDRLVALNHVEATHVREGEGGLVASAVAAGRYAIVLVAKGA